MYDADMTTLMIAFPLEESRARDWFTALCTAYEAESSDSEVFGERLAEESGHVVDSADLQLFFEELERIGGDRMELIGRLAERGPDELAEVHRDLVTSPADPEDPASPADGDRFDWVPPEQAERMAAAWGDWAPVLAEQLDYRWGAGWESNTPEHKAEWLTDVLAELLADSPQPEAQRFAWVPAELSDRLQSAWGPDWTQYLGEQLDHRWGVGWEANPDEHKAAWLPELVEELLNPAEDIPAQQAAPDVESPPASPAAESQATGGPGGGAAEPSGSAATGPAETADYSAEDIRSTVDDVIAEVPGAENLSEEELAQIRAEVAEALARESTAAQ